MKYRRILIAVLIFMMVYLIYGSNNYDNNYNSLLSDLGGNFKTAVTTVAESDKITMKNDMDIFGWGLSKKPGIPDPQPDPGKDELIKKYGALYIGDKTKKVIYLTFDEGYENGYTNKILDVLKGNQLKVIFFITGPYLKNHSDIVKRMLSEGHEIGNHSVRHPSLPTISDKEIEEEILGLDRAFFEMTEKHMRFLRPPKGEYNERTLELTNNLGYTNLFWSFAYFDWDPKKQKGAEYAKQKIIEGFHNGEVMLLHAVSVDNANVLDSVIKEAKVQGYLFGTPDELYNFNKK